MSTKIFNSLIEAEMESSGMNFMIRAMRQLGQMKREEAAAAKREEEAAKAKAEKWARLLDLIVYE